MCSRATCRRATRRSEQNTHTHASSVWRRERGGRGGRRRRRGGGRRRRHGGGGSLSGVKRESTARAAGRSEVRISVCAYARLAGRAAAGAGPTLEGDFSSERPTTQRKPLCCVRCLARVHVRERDEAGGRGCGGAEAVRARGRVLTRDCCGRRSLRLPCVAPHRTDESVALWRGPDRLRAALRQEVALGSHPPTSHRASVSW